MYTINRAYLAVLFKALEAAGAPATPHLANQAADAGYVKLATAYQWLQEVVSETGNPDIGLAVLTHAHPGMLGMLGYAVMSCPTLGDALQRLVKFHPLTSNGSCLLLERREGTVKMIGFEIGPRAPRVFIDSGLAMMLGLLQWLAADVRSALLGVELSYPQPADTRVLKALLGDNIRFSSPSNSLIFNETVCDLPLLTASPTFDAMHGEALQNQLQAIIDGSMAARVRHALNEHMAQGVVPALAAVARHLSVSERAMQHALEREGVNFSSLLDECRLALAHRLLRDSLRSLKYISASLGFREQSSFHKASLRWFGMSPGRYRALR